MNGKTTISPLTQWRNLSAFTGYRLSVVLVLGAFLMLPLPAPEKSQVLSLAVIQIVYAVLVVATLTLAPKGLSISRRAAIVSLLMVAFIVFVAVILEAKEVALLLFIPVVNAAFRLSGRGLVVVCLISGLAWLGIYSWPEIPELWVWPRVVAGLLPLGLVAYIVRVLRDDNDIARSRLTALSYQDELTGVLNMRAFSRLLMANHSNAEYAKTSYALLMVDVENLRALNEKHGHEQGNRVLVAVAEALKRSIRRNDLVARYGGDEFIVYLSGANAEVAQTVCNRIAQNVYNISLAFSRSAHRVEVSVGSAVYPDNGQSIQDIMTFSDSAMYKEKEFLRRVNPADRSGDKGRAQAGLEN